MRKIIGVYLFGTRWVDFFGLGIAFTQGKFKRLRWPAHVGIAFQFSDMSIEGFEARFKGNAQKPDGGFFGPFNVAEKRRAYRRWPKKLWTLQLPVSLVIAQRMHTKCLDLTATVKGYGRTQLLAKLLHEAKGWPVQTDPSIVDCSESAAMVLAVDPCFDLRDELNANFDAMTPYEVWTGVLNILQRIGAVPGEAPA